MLGKFLLSLLLTITPLIELRGGLPLAIISAKEIGIPIFIMFLLVVLINILLIFAIFWFLDNLHELFMKIKLYRILFGFALKRIRKKIDKFEAKHESGGFWALVAFVGVPLPLTGAWSGCLLSWVLGIDRKKSIGAIALGVLIAGILILAGTLGVISSF